MISVMQLTPLRWLAWLALLARQLGECGIQLRVHPIELLGHFLEVPLGAACPLVQQPKIFRRNSRELDVHRAAHLLRYRRSVCFRLRLKCLFVLRLETDFR